MYSEYIYKCKMILEWAYYKPKFDTSFINSIIEYYDDVGKFTLSQETAIDNIIRRWNVKC